MMRANNNLVSGDPLSLGRRVAVRRPHVGGEHVFHLRHETDDVLDQNERHGVVLNTLALRPQNFLVAPGTHNVSMLIMTS